METKVTSRRGFLAGILASSAYAVPSWADAGSPAFLSAARRPNGSYALFGLSLSGQQIFEIPLPGRGHAAAAHPSHPLAVGFARRPGTFAFVIDCASGQIKHQLEAPTGRHFYGHGAFSSDGALLFTTENDYENADGIIGVWDAQRGFRRIGEFASHGVGPHEMRLMPNGESLVVANGGIETHPDSGRTKLNIPTMQPNLTYLSLDGVLLDHVEAERSMRKSSIRHLAVREDGLVAAGCQWQGTTTDAQLIFTHRRGGKLKGVLETSLARQLSGYIGSIAFSRDGSSIAATSPRGDQMLLVNVATNEVEVVSQEDVCGVASGASGLAFTTGKGRFLQTRGKTKAETNRSNVQWDNHLVAL